MDEIKICLVGSSGGHLMHLYWLKEYWEKYDRFWVTFEKEDAKSLLINEKKYWCYYSAKRAMEHRFKKFKTSIHHWKSI